MIGFEEMEISKGIRAKIFLLLLFMGLGPFTVLVIVSAMSNVAELEDHVKQNSQLKNDIISEHMSELIAKNQAVLQSLALSPNVISYLKSPTPEKLEYVSKILYDTDIIFKDRNYTAMTGADGWQILRTDGEKGVNLKKRQHFQEAMKGRRYVSDIITSMANGKMIIVTEVPVIDEDGTPIGMLQRNFDLVGLQDFIQNFGDSETFVVVMDRNGKVIANSRSGEEIGAEYEIDNSYKFILDRVYNSSGVIPLEINGEKALVAYARNIDTGWMIVTIRPYHYILEQVYGKVAKALIFGLVMLFIGTFIAYMLTLRVTKPIIEVTKAVEEIAEGNTDIEKIEVVSNDEIGQMAAAFNKIRSERDKITSERDKVTSERDKISSERDKVTSERDFFKMESQLDKLTELFNKTTMENLCKMKLKTFNENESSNIFMAFYVIDLDHFKEVNDFFGHQFGDKVLVEFAKGLKKIFRPNDCIGRFGGDEFVVIVDSLPNMEVVIRKAEQIKQIASNLAVEGKAHIVTASIGIAIAPQNGRDYDSLFAAADKGVYHVKNNGKNGYYCDLFKEN